MKIVLAAVEDRMADAWQAQCGDLPGVVIHRGSIFDVDCDALVSPANSFGFMDGEIDLLYSQRFGWDLQLRLREAIRDYHHGELLIGNAEIVETRDEGHPFLIAAPTMRVPMYLGETTVNPYLATRAALLLIRQHSFASGQLTGQAVASYVKSAAFPDMGTGVGRVTADICAHQMRKAIEDVCLNPPRLPSSWAEASENHQLLYTDKPTRLQ